MTAVAPYRIAMLALNNKGTGYLLLPHLWTELINMIRPMRVPQETQTPTSALIGHTSVTQQHDIWTTLSPCRQRIYRSVPDHCTATEARAWECRYYQTAGRAGRGRACWGGSETISHASQLTIAVTLAQNTHSIVLGNCNNISFRRSALWKTD